MESVISGTISNIFEVVPYDNERGDYERQEFIITTLDDYKQEVLFSAYAKKPKKLPRLTIGEEVIITFWLKSKQAANGKYYTNLQVVKIEPLILKVDSING